VYKGFGVAGLAFDWVKERGGDDVLPRMEFYPDSRLLKINGCPNEEDCGLYDYEMIDGKGLKLLRVELVPIESQHPQLPYRAKRIVSIGSKSGTILQHAQTPG
jgi:hypothetical protein